MKDISSSDASSKAKNVQIIEEFIRNIPFETMTDVDTISPPLNTPSTRSHYNSNIIELHSHTQSTIENIEKRAGNIHLRENAVDRAMAKQPQEFH
ncbi:hypothetical protein [Limnovirga soli]|jgi:hypothetical protein|uniref:Uncharacterized protein n=1 Tax=Limnovirga soli TaxID=2656915 RepID=A0A8J8FE10_9BACT|nr:hypothetical protein [Limnovirga soli]NNV54892.1 hypothetical protein [Limnovirga soli]